jgi:hypothetical protein
MLRPRNIKKKIHKTFADTEKHLERWSEHFEKLLNKTAPYNPPNITEAEIDLEIKCDNSDIPSKDNSCN